MNILGTSATYTETPTGNNIGSKGKNYTNTLESDIIIIGARMRGE